MRQLTEKDVEIIIEPLPEDTPVRGNALASGDDKADKRAEDRIIRELDKGNDWAWCTVRVSAKWKEFQGTDYLGCCSYRSEKDFRKGGYLPQMIDAALDDLNQTIKRYADMMGELSQS